MNRRERRALASKSNEKGRFVIAGKMKTSSRAGGSEGRSASIKIKKVAK